MRVLSAIVEVAALSVLNVWQHLAFRCAVAPQLVGHDHTRHILQAAKQPFEEPLCRLRISTTLYKDVEHDAILVHRAPEVLKLPLDPDEDLVQMPLVTRLRPTTTHFVLANSASNLSHQRRMLS